MQYLLSKGLFMKINNTTQTIDLSNSTDALLIAKLIGMFWYSSSKFINLLKSANSNEGPTTLDGK